MLQVISEEKVERLLENNELVVWYGQITADESFYDAYWAVLDKVEKAQAARIQNPLLHKRYVEVHGRLRQLVAQKLKHSPSELIIKKAEHGKPYLADYPQLAFNLSHSADKFILAIALNCQLGIDIESCKRRVNLDGLVNKCFASEEITYWRQLPDTEKPQAFYRFWTRKEAFVKATGKGIVLGLNACVINPKKPQEFLRVPAQCGIASDWFVQDIVLESEVCSALVTNKKFSKIKLINV